VTVRTDLEIQYYRDPRILLVDEPSTEITVQDLVDTIRVAESSFTGMSYPHLIDAAGKEPLGGGVLVGITASLQNAKLGFRSRLIPNSTGSATSNDPSGTLLEDTAADFVADNVQPGSVVQNITTGAHATVYQVIDLNTLDTEVFEGGTRQTWEIGDTYHIHNIVQCNVSGGNLVAVDGVGAEAESIFPTAFTQVVRTAAASATLQELGTLQFSSFDGGVWINTASSNTGTSFPNGTLQAPVNNLTDAQTIATSRGFATLYVLGDITLDATANLTGFALFGESDNKTTITIEDAATVTNCEFFTCTVQGTLDGGNVVKDARIIDLNFVDGFIQQCVLDGTVTLSGLGEADFLDCWSGIPGQDETPIINMNGSGSALVMRNYSGGVMLTNKTGSDAVSIDMASGQVKLDPSIQAGPITIRGVGKLVDNSTAATGQIHNELLDPVMFRAIEKLLMNKMITDPVTGELTVYSDDGARIEKQGQLYEDAAGTQTYRGQGSERRERLQGGPLLRSSLAAAGTFTGTAPSVVVA
jgi:hypothetical protein